MTLALPCACALTLGCLAALLVPPNGALEDEVHLQRILEPRMAGLFGSFGKINKYIEKFFGNSAKKSKTHKKPSNTTTSTPSNTTVHPHLNVTKPMQSTSKPLTQEPRERLSLAPSPDSSMNNERQ